MTKISTDAFRRAERGDFDLAGRPTRIEPVYKGKEGYQELLAGHIGRLSQLQERLFASGAGSVLVLFQALDAAGKDGAIKHVMTGINPQGCEVSSFKQPGPVELQHDFLWRFACALPERGRIGIFNRSYYEEVLIARVHPELLTSEEQVPPGSDPEKIFKGRYRSIRHFEKHLAHNGVRIVKIFLHLSKEEQRQRFLARINEPEKSWKLSLNDIQERRSFDAYTHAYERAIGATSSKSAPWWIIPADDKETARLIISQILVDTLKDMDLHLPEPTRERLELLETYRRELEAEA